MVKINVDITTTDKNKAIRIHRNLARRLIFNRRQKGFLVLRFKFIKRLGVREFKNEILKREPRKKNFIMVTQL